MKNEEKSCQNCNTDENYRFKLPDYSEYVGNNKLIFVMINPASDGHKKKYKNGNEKFDETISNCIKIAEKNKYKGIEIINLYPFISKEIITAVSCSYSKQKQNKETWDEIAKNIKQKNIVISWGELGQKVCKTLRQDLFNTFKESTFLELVNKKDKEIQSEKLRAFPTHPSNRGLNKIGGINNVNLRSMDKKRIEQIFGIE